MFYQLRIYFIIGLFGLAITNAKATVVTTLQCTVNNYKPLIGQAVRLNIRVTTIKNSTVSCQLINSFFNQTDNIKLLQLPGIVKDNNGVFTCEFVFTAVKAGNVNIKPLPVFIIQQGMVQTLFTPSITLRFINDKMPGSIQEIKPVIPVNTWIVVLVICCGLLVILALTTLIAFLGLIVKKQIEKIILNKQRSFFVHKLIKLELLVSEGSLSTDDFIVETTALLTQYLQCRLANNQQNSDVIPDLIQFGNKIKFMPPPILEPDFRNYLDHTRAILIPHIETLK